MGTRGHAGVINDDGTVSVRYVHSDATLEYLPFAIAGIWWATFDRDTAATVAALLEHDWEDLDPTTRSDSTHWAGGTPVPGVGMSIQPLTDGPVTGLPRQLHTEGLLFLLDPTRPGTLVIADGSCDHLDLAPVFDLTVGETVVIEQR